MRNNKTSWDAAENFCRSEGGHLASVKSKEVHEYMLERVGQSLMWIGATDKKREGSWEWTDCSPFNFIGWAYGEPSKKTTENCMELYRAEKHLQGWNDLDCNTSLNFVCARTICSGTMPHWINFINLFFGRYQ